MNEEESRIERLKRTLYSRNQDIIPKTERKTISPEDFDVKTDWGEKPDFGISPDEIVKKNNSFFNKFFFWSVVFFALSVLVASYIFFGGINTISSNNLSIDVVAPTTVSSGEEVQLGLSILNGNRADLESATLYIQYPTGTESALEEGRAITRDKIDLGVIKKGDRVEQNLRVILFGEKDTLKSFVFRIEYKVKGSNATFSKEKSYEVVIGSSPLLLEIDYPKEVNSGQDINITINITSNSSVPIQNTLVKIEYPYGFTYKNSNIKPVRDDSVWNLGDLKNGDKKSISVTGNLIGQNLEDRSFRISAGTKEGSIEDFDVPLSSTLITLGLRKSFFDLDLSSTQKNTAQVGQSVPIYIKWQNTLPDKIFDSQIEAVVSGNALDRSKVSPLSGGYYRSVDDTVVWDKNSFEKLIEILPGESGQTTLSVSSLPNLVQPKFIKNPVINLKVKMFGERGGRDSGTVTSESLITIKIPSTVSITSKSLRDSGPFTNTGSIPPKVDKETTYTINWVVTNTTSDLKNTIVRATIPPGVSWKGQISPSGEKVTFDPNTNTITWDVGNVSAGAGFVYSPKQVYFKVGIIPSINDVGLVPVLVNQASLVSNDTHSLISVSSNAPQTSTRYADSNFITGKDVVVK